MADVTNLGTGGSTLDAQYGSTGGADTNDPRHLAHTGTNYIYAPGAATADNLSIPHVAGEQVGDVMDIRIDLAAEDWTPTGTLFIAGKATSLSAASTSWAIGLDSSNRFYFAVSDGTTIPLWRPAVMASAPFVDGQRLRLRVTYTRNTGGGSYAMGLDYSIDFTTPLGDITEWTNISSTTGAAIGAMQDIATPLYVTAYRNSTAGVPGKYYGFHLKVGGVTKVDIDTSVITSGRATSFPARTGQTVTINRTTSGRKVVAVTAPCWLLGTDDYLEVPDDPLLDFAAGESFTVLVAHRARATFGTSDALAAKKADTTAATQGWALTAGSSTAAQAQLQVGDGAAGATAVSGSRTSGAVSVVAGVRDTTADTLTVYLNGTAGTPVTDTTTSSSANAEVLRIGRLSGAAAGYADAEVMAAAVWRRALTAAEIAALTSYMQSRWP